MNNKALVVIDIQNDITKNYKEIINNINKAIDWAKDNKIHIIYIKNIYLSEGTKTFKLNTRGSELVSEMNIKSDNIFIKTKSNALTSEEFASFIKRNEINEFYIMGADATGCIKSTCFNMTKEGYEVHVLSDCITSYNKKKIGEMLEYYKNKGCIVEELNDIM